MVVYSSTSAWTALFAYAKGEFISWNQWLGVLLVTIGLVCNGYINTDLAHEKAPDVLPGFGLCLIGTCLHSFFVVDMNARLRDARMMLTDRHFGACLGVMETLLLISYPGGPLWHIPTDWATLQQMREAPNALAICAGIVGLTLSNWFHTLAFFAVLKASGPVFSALLKAIQTVCVFGLSSILFCSSEAPSQCATWGKSLSVLVLVVGLVVYGQAAHDNTREKQNNVLPSAFECDGRKGVN